MATDKKTLREWFKNLSKPTQYHFWAWLDSFWHKNEKIPQENIEGIDEMLNNVASAEDLKHYVLTDGANINEHSREKLREKLGVGDLPENIATTDYVDQNAKNVANSKPTSVGGAGLNLGAMWEIDTQGYPMKIQSLADKSNDTTFNRMLVQNEDGTLAISNGNGILKNLPDILNETEKLAWKTAMNGGWTTNTMSVAIINPFIIENTDNNTWIAIKGAGLNLNPTNFSIQIINEAGNEVLATIDNSQVQLYQNGTDLVFYYNFSTIGLGEYKIRLNNGIATYTTNDTISVVSQLQQIPFEQGEIRLISGTSAINVATENGVVLRPDENIKQLEVQEILGDYVAGWVDGNLLKGNEDWWLSVLVQSDVKSSWAAKRAIGVLGLSQYVDTGLISPYISLIEIYNHPAGYSNLQNADINLVGSGVLNDSANNTMVNFIKRGNIISTIMVSNNKSIIGISSVDTSVDYRLVANVNNQEANRSQGFKITKLKYVKL